MIHTEEIITNTARETADKGYQMAEELRLREGSGEARLPIIICLYGDLGSGKTTFAQGFAKGLGLTTRLPSPTFIIVRRYTLLRTEFLLYHIDLYRLHSAEDILALGIQEIFADPNAYVLVEWAERLERLLPEKRLDIHFVSLQDDAHRIKIQKI